MKHQQAFGLGAESIHCILAFVESKFFLFLQPVKSEENRARQLFSFVLVMRKGVEMDHQRRGDPERRGTDQTGIFQGWSLRLTIDVNMTFRPSLPLHFS